MKKALLFYLLVIPFFFGGINAQNIRLRLIADNLTSPVFISTPDDQTNRMFIVDQIGLIKILDSTGTMMEEPFLDIRNKIVALRPGYDERGLLGLAFHPEFADNGKFYIHYSAPSADTAYDHLTIISEFRISESDSNIADTTTERQLLTLNHPQFNHNGGSLEFGPQDGYLYIAIGDGGNRDDVGFGHEEDWYDVNPGGNAQNINANFLGKILRIDVDASIEPYGIPLDNPFVNDTTGLQEIYAYGFRNPYRMSFDMGGTNQLFVSDAGQDLFEEVSIVEAGGNYGWNVKEGIHCFDASNPTNPLTECPDTDGYGNKLSDPVIEFLNSSSDSINGVGTVVIGGYVYRGQAIPELDGKYIFGAFTFSPLFPSGRLLVATPGSTDSLWTVDGLNILDSLTAVPGEAGQLNHYLLGFGQDREGEMYILTTDSLGPSGNSGKVYMVLPGEGLVGVYDGAISPKDYLLNPTYPNPFNPATTISFELPLQSQVELKVFDIMGREVATLLNGVKGAGKHSIKFEAGSLSSGMYIYRLKAGSIIKTQKMMLMK